MIIYLYLLFLKKKNLWTREYFLVTEETFPSILTRSKVKEHHQIEISPIETALRSIEKKNSEITDLYTTLSVEPKQEKVASLTMTLNGIIDAEVNGGIPKYKEAFLLPDYLETYPEDTKRLKEALRKFIQVVGEALKVHKKLCPENLSQLQEKLEGMYKQTSISIYIIILYKIINIFSGFYEEKMITQLNSL